MCNLYLMYYTLSEQDDFKLCFDEDVKGLADKLPQGDCVIGGKNSVAALPPLWAAPAPEVRSPEADSA